MRRIVVNEPAIHRGQQAGAVKLGSVVAEVLVGSGEP